MANSTLFGTVKILGGPKFGTKSGVWEAFLGPNEVCKPGVGLHTFFGVTIKTLQVAEWSVICQ